MTPNKSITHTHTYSVRDHVTISSIIWYWLWAVMQRSLIAYCRSRVALAMRHRLKVYWTEISTKTRSAAPFTATLQYSYWHKTINTHTHTHTHFFYIYNKITNRRKAKHRAQHNCVVHNRKMERCDEPATLDHLQKLNHLTNDGFRCSTPSYRYRKAIIFDRWRVTAANPRIPRLSAGASA